MPSFGTWARPENSANTACISTGLATRCGDRRWSGPRSGIAATAGSRSTAPIIWWCATAWDIGRSDTAFFSKTGPRSTTSSTATWRCRRARVSRCRARPSPFDRNEGAGFWWANSRNAFVRNVAVECDQYGFRYEAPATPGFDGVLLVRGVDDDVRRPMDIRTLPFLRFEDNEAHAQRRYGFNLGGGPGSVLKGAWAASALTSSTRSRSAACGSGMRTGPSPGRSQRPDRWSGYSVLRLWSVASTLCGARIPEADHLSDGWAFYDETGRSPDPGLPGPLDPIDDRPPVTVMTRFPWPRSAAGRSGYDGRRRHRSQRSG